MWQMYIVFWVTYQKRIIVSSLAHQLFDLIPERNVVAWNIVTIGYLKGWRILGVLKLFWK
jgi:hypothetical protein